MASESRKRTYTLLDGSIVTVKEVASVTGLSLNGAYCRLNKSNDPSFIFSDSNTSTKFYALSDGRNVTVKTVAELVGISSSSARKRLNNSTDPEVIFSKPHLGFDKYALSDGRIVTANEVANSTGITTSAARLRLKRSSDPAVIFAEPCQTTDFSLNAKNYHLSNGQTATVRELSDLTGIRENTIRLRLETSTDYDYVTRPLVFENLNANFYIFEDGSEITVGDFAKARGCSYVAAYDFLESMRLEKKRYRKKYKLDNGTYVTIDDIAAQTKVSLRTAKHRIKKSRDPEIVLAPLGTRHDKKYELTDGTFVTAKEVSNATGITFESAKQRLVKTKIRKEVFKPHFSKRKRPVKVTRYNESGTGPDKVIEIRKAEINY